MEEGRSSFKMLTGESIGKRSLGRPRRRGEDYIPLFFLSFISSFISFSLFIYGIHFLIFRGSYFTINRDFPFPKDDNGRHFPYLSGAF